MVAVLLEFGADPLHPVQPSKKLFSYNSSLMSLAAMAEDPHMTEMLLNAISLFLVLVLYIQLHTAVISIPCDSLCSMAPT